MFYPYNIRRPSKMEFGTKRIPDYTELAYKEAVGKLRYFLSGNYSPSVRSYGGSASIKNLEDQDPLDKKYTPSYTVPDYRPRPKLTTKYTSLYADSLNNYTPPTNVAPPAPPAAAAELTTTSPEVVHFIQKQEEYIEQLERESQYCRDELNTLLGKVKEVISENEHLHSAQQSKLLSRMFHTYAGSETDDLEDSTGLDSDHKLTPSKNRRPGKSRAPKMEGSNIMFESRIAELEAQLTQAKIDLKKSQEENNDNKRKLASGIVDSTCLDGFKRQIDNFQRDKNSLESQIAKMKLSLERREADPDSSYKRGSDAVEQQLREERSNLDAEVRRLKEDLAKERGRVRELCGESARRAVHERSAAEQRYTAHFDELSHDLAAQYDNVAKLQLELERQRRDENDLKREISMKNAVIEELKMELKNKTSSLQADLAQAHAEKASLDEELASARLAIERHQRQSKHETNRLNSEIQSLRQRLDRADADLVHARRENLRLTEQIANLETELKMKDLTPTSPVRNKKEKEIEHAKTVAELETMIQSQNSLMEKLTGECRLLTDKLDDANRRHKEELASLHRQVDSLGRTMQHANAPNTYYEAPSTHAATAHGNIEPTPPPGPVHTRGNPPADAMLRRQPSNSSVGDRHSNSQSRQLSRQPSKSSIRMENQPDVNSQNEKEYAKESPVNEQYLDETPVKEEYVDSKVADNTQEMERQNYEQTQPEYVQEPTYNEEPSHFEQQQAEYNQEQTYQEPAYEQEPANYQSYAQETPAYQTEGYDQSYEQPAYTEGQYQENYDQQYVDPNAQYDGQYENYATDPNQAYQADPNYGNQAYDASNPEYDSQVQDAQNTDLAQQNQNIPAETKDYVESKITTSPIAKVPTQS